MARKSGDCYIDVWRDVDFRGETRRIYGPAEYAALDFAEGNWGDDIGSLRVGPNAFVMAYHRRDFQDDPITFGPDDEVADLSQFKFDDDIESLNVIDSLKIFNHLAYNSDLAPEPPEADSTGDDQLRPTSNKGRRGKVRKL
ncbi:MAG: hypothetical protein QOH49_4490 [Acidobacteriota bacterium]|jgi:hypothetical protein|nr:hypothetical protein [Acidobacteriota bacterium]